MIQQGKDLANEVVAYNKQYSWNHWRDFFSWCWPCCIGHPKDIQVWFAQGSIICLALRFSRGFLLLIEFALATFSWVYCFQIPMPNWQSIFFRPWLHGNTAWKFWLWIFDIYFCLRMVSVACPSCASAPLHSITKFWWKSGQIVRSARGCCAARY